MHSLNMQPMSATDLKYHKREEENSPSQTPSQQGKLAQGTASGQGHRQQKHLPVQYKLKINLFH